MAGATVLHQHPDSPRVSQDLDPFHDAEDALQAAIESDVRTLCASGFGVEVQQRSRSFARAFVYRGATQTKIEWAQDTAFRFFPVEPDLDLGWRINFWDAATNKVLAFAGRSEVRDLLDILYLHETHLHLGALVWAASGKDPGYTPSSILDWGWRNIEIDEREFKFLPFPVGVSAVQLRDRIATLLAEARKLIERLPASEPGCLYLGSAGKPVCPDPASSEFLRLTRHFGSVKGAWPRIADA